MKSVAYIMFVFITISCASNHRTTLVKYKPEMDKTYIKSTIYSMRIPKRYYLITLKGGHKELEKQYIYSDSIKLYISNFQCSVVNYHNILSLGDSIAIKRFEGEELKASIAKALNNKYTRETIILQGKTSTGFWKDIKMGDLSVGYTNVPESRKDEFDNILNAFRSNN